MCEPADLSDKFHNIREERKVTETARLQMVKQITEAHASLQDQLKANSLQLMQGRIAKQMEQKLHELQTITPDETELKLRCDTKYIETAILHLGDIVEEQSVVPKYDTFQLPKHVVGKRGIRPGRLASPYGVAIHEENNQIFVADSENDRVGIFSDVGEYLGQMCASQLIYPYGIAIHADNMYISSSVNHTVSRYSLTDMSLVKKVGGIGPTNGQFNEPRQITTDPTGRVFITDKCNFRICIYDRDLRHFNNIRHQSISDPYDVKVSGDHLYVLCPFDNPYIHVFTLDGEKLHSLITPGPGMRLLKPLFFCMDKLNNFVLSDRDSDLIRVFSLKGNLLHTIGGEGQGQGMLKRPQGVALTPNGKLVCVSHNNDHCLRIFY